MNRILGSLILITTIYVTFSCGDRVEDQDRVKSPSGPFVVVLGIAQDAGFPQADCKKECCRDAWIDPAKRKMVSSIGIADPMTKQCWIIDATPDFKDQLRLMKIHDGLEYDLAGILLTHAHIGHYTGLVHLGREVMGTRNIPVYAMPVMTKFLTDNGPWSQLVSLDNIALKPLSADSTISLNDNIRITPVRVPHRDEYSETVGYSISGPDKSMLFIPDIDKWSRWNQNILDQVVHHDYALIDGSFYKNGEIPNRDMSEIPHPFITETMAILDKMNREDRQKVNFIHLNHTNPVLDPLSSEHQEVIHKGYKVCEEGQIFLM